jgi:hypothetical protein
MSSVIVTNRDDEDVDFEDSAGEETDATDATEPDKKKPALKTKGRGHKYGGNVDSRYAGRQGKFDSVTEAKSHGTNQKCTSKLLFTLCQPFASNTFCWVQSANHSCDLSIFPSC